jgi:quercetin 2,3-dioxygenase
MLYLRPATDRGRADFGWLKSNHSFSFGGYHDPKHMGFSALRVINDDWVDAGAGFDSHGHRDMEIISYVLEGAIAHKDSMGNEFVVPAGEVQRMTAGTGVTHSEFNHSATEALKFLQIWVLPNKQGIEPGYEQKKVEQNGKLTLLVSPDGQDDSVSIHQDAYMSRLQLGANESIELDAKERAGYLHVISGTAQVNGDTFANGDGVGCVGEPLSVTTAEEGLIALWFDLPSVDTGQ